VLKPIYLEMKAEDMNEGYDEVTELFIQAEAKRQSKLKKQKRNLRVMENATNFLSPSKNNGCK